MSSSSAKKQSKKDRSRFFMPIKLIYHFSIKDLILNYFNFRNSKRWNSTKDWKSGIKSEQIGNW